MLNRFIEILISMVILIPVFWMLNRIRFQNAMKTGAYFLFGSYLAAVYLFVGMPTLQFMRFELSLTLIPFLPMIADLKNTILNIILFVPLGIMLPFLWRKFRMLRATMLFGFGMSLSIEILQILTYRATDINDLIANTLGTVLGYFIFSVLSRAFPPIRKFAEKQNEVFAVILPVLIVMFFVQPYLANLYYKIT